MTKRTTTETKREDVYSRVTNRIVEQLEQGVRPWTKPWSASDAAGIAVPLRAKGKPYRGVNVLILWMEAMARGYGARFWMTYRQAGELGGRVRKGEKGTMVVFTSTVTKTETDDDGEAVDREIRFLKTYHVFNALCRYRHNAFYADVRIMPTWVWRPVWQAGIAEMASA